MEKIFRGDIVKRKNGSLYKLVHITQDKLHLINLKSGNRWSSYGLDYKSEFGNLYVTREQIEKDGFIISEIGSKSNRENDIKKTKNISINELDIARVFAYAICGIESQDIKVIINEAAKSVFNYLLEKGIIEEEK